MIIQIKKAIFSKTSKDTFVTLVGNALSSFLAIIFTILAARFLGPENWGVVAAVISLVVIIEAIGDLGLGSSLFMFVSVDWVKGKKERANSTLSTIFLIRLVTAFVLLLILVAVAGTLDRIVLNNHGITIVILGALSAFVYLLFDFQVTVMQAKHSWFRAASLNILSNLVRLLLVVVLFAMQMVSIVSILLAFMISPLVVFLFSLLWYKPKLRFQHDWGNAKNKVVPFSGWLGVNRLAGSVASRLDVILLLLFLGEYQTGIFAAAKQLAIGVPLVVASLATVLAPRLATLRKDSLVAYFKKTILLSILISLGLGVGIIITPLVIELFGPKYASSTFILQLLLVGYVPFVLSMPALNFLIYSLGKPRVVGIISLVQLPVIYLIYLLVIPQYGLAGAAVVNGVWNFSSMVIAYFFALRYVGRNAYKRSR